MAIKGTLQNVFTRKRLVLLGTYFIMLVLAVILLDQFAMPWYTKHGEALAVPNVIAQRFEDAKELLELQGLDVVKAGEKNNAHLPFGYVVEQSPLPNRLVKMGRRVYLTISTGERKFQMPNFIGLSETNARERLKSYSLLLEDIVYRYSAEEPRDVVMAQSKDHGTLVKVGTPIEITVSLGEPTENVIVPSLLGKTFNVAKRELQKAGLVVGNITYKINNDYIPNSVLFQSLEAETEAAHGDTVDLLITRFKQE
ncbi:PASTA domain-containing protein [candidate division KSB1 bacterium]|nr:PASTA domain-containing protein [candidate division KSB1 bacterium]